MKAEREIYISIFESLYTWKAKNKGIQTWQGLTRGAGATSLTAPWSGSKGTTFSLPIASTGPALLWLNTCWRTPQQQEACLWTNDRSVSHGLNCGLTTEKASSTWKTYSKPSYLSGKALMYSKPEQGTPSLHHFEAWGQAARMLFWSLASFDIFA